MYVFGPFTLDPDRFDLAKDGVPLAPEPQVFALIVLLVQNADRIVTKDELIAAVWDGRIVSDATITSRINAARRILDDDGQQQKVIRTFPRRGVRFVADLARQTDAPAAVQAPQARHSRTIRLMPFVSLSDDPGDGFIAEGITEDVVAGLSRLPEFQVVREGSFFGQGSAVPVQGAGYLLSGSVRRGGARVRVSVQLVEEATGATLLAENFDREFSDVLALQTDVALAIVATFELAMSQAERVRATRIATRDADAWSLYYRGMSHLIDRGEYAQPVEMRRAQELFREAIARDPGFARALTGLAMSQFFMFVTDRDGADLTEGFEAIRKAIALDPRDAFAYSVLCGLHFRSGESAAAIEAGRQALELNPAFGWAHGLLGVALVCAGRPRDGIAHLKINLGAGRVNPGRGPSMGQMAMAHLYLKDFEGAVKWANRALALPSTQYWANMALASAYGHLGNPDDAAIALRGLLYRQPGLTLESMAKIPQITDAGCMAILVEGLKKAGLP